MKKMIWLGMGIGSTVGGALPMLWNSNGLFSMSSIILTAVGGLVGIWAGLKTAQYFGL